MSAFLARALVDCQPHLPNGFRIEHQRLFHAEHLQKLAQRLSELFEKGVPEGFPPPTMAVECTPPIAEAFAPFRDVLIRWGTTEGDPSPEQCQQLAAALVKAGTEYLLVLLGQRLTPGSLTDSRAIPRPKDFLLRSAQKIHAGKLSVGARALTKHLQRSPSQFWGEMTGNDEKKNQSAQQKINSILVEATWWNVFEHYKHDVVFEARNADGYGVRWGNDGQTLIGFLEPFTPGFPLRREDEPEG